MSTRLWFRLEDVLPLAEHALACPTHRVTGAQGAAGGSNGPALTLTHTRTSGILRSKGVPVWRDAHGEQQTACSSSWHPTAPCTPTPTVESAFLPLRHRGRDHRRLIDVLRAGRDLKHHWLVVRPRTRPGEVLGSDRLRVLDYRDDIAPTDTRWRPRLVTSPRIGDWGYPALVANGYTTSVGSLICRFDARTAHRMAARLDGPWRSDSMPGEHPRLRFDGDTLVLLEEHDTGDQIRLDVVDRCHPDRDGYYSIGAHLWFWQDSASTRLPARSRLRLGLTALTGRARQILASSYDLRAQHSGTPTDSGAFR
ncbi:hypothetical protein GCM10023176_41120 [Micromonospora coerulea]|uniref:Uncharacterized protein n=1 Tax=Micromonospora coerulea TaxID=47856 RepID=A0ABP8ST13_9ACTN